MHSISPEPLSSITSLQLVPAELGHQDQDEQPRHPRRWPPGWPTVPATLAELVAAVDAAAPPNRPKTYKKRATST